MVEDLIFYLGTLRGLADADAGRVIPHAEVGRLIQEWFDEAQSQSQREE